MEFAPNHLMTAKKALKDAQAQENHVSPFEQISKIEAEQEQRVAALNEKAMTEEKEVEKTILLTEKEQEETLKKDANDELKKYSQSEPATILKEYEQATNEEVQTMKSNMSKQLAKKADGLVHDFIKNTSSLISA